MKTAADLTNEIENLIRYCIDRRDELDRMIYCTPAEAQSEVYEEIAKKLFNILNWSA